MAIKKKIKQINLIPLINIIFLMLIFFLLHIFFNFLNQKKI